MTGHATQVLVLECTGRKQFVSFLMTSGAILGGCFFIIDNYLRHVCLMALFAVGISLFREVCFVTLGAFWDLAMRIVARAAEQRSMFAFIFPQFYDLGRMASQTGVSDIPTHFYVQRHMGIEVTTVTRSQLVMRFTFVALAAERDDLSCRRRVTNMAVLATNLCFVFCACCGDIRRSLAVAFDAVIIK